MQKQILLRLQCQTNDELIRKTPSTFPNEISRLYLDYLHIIYIISILSTYACILRIIWSFLKSQASPNVTINAFSKTVQMIRTKDEDSGCVMCRKVS